MRRRKGREERISYLDRKDHRGIYKNTLEGGEDDLLQLIMRREQGPQGQAEKNEDDDANVSDANYCRRYRSERISCP